MSCKTSAGITASKKEVEDLEAAVPEQEGKTGGTKDIPGRAWRPPRTAAVQARACLEKYCKSHAFERGLTDVVTVPTSVIFGRKCPVADDQPTSWKHTHTAEAEETKCTPPTPQHHYSSLTPKS